MGTDIHNLVEYKENNKWVTAKRKFKSDMYIKKHKFFGADDYLFNDEPIHARNYTLFAYLANVRNGYGFGGCDTGETITPYHNPKGLPDNISTYAKSNLDGLHTYSYLTLYELKDALKKSKIITKINRGYVQANEYQHFKINGYPKSWCGDVGGVGIKKISNSEMEMMIKKLNTDLKPFYTQIEWKTNLHNGIKKPMEHLINEIESNLNYKSDHDVRLVFGFDS